MAGVRKKNKCCNKVYTLILKVNVLKILNKQMQIIVKFLEVKYNIFFCNNKVIKIEKSTIIIWNITCNEMASYFVKKMTSSIL